MHKVDLDITVFLEPCYLFECCSNRLGSNEISLGSSPINGFNEMGFHAMGTMLPQPAALVKRFLLAAQCSPPMTEFDVNHRG